MQKERKGSKVHDSNQFFFAKIKETVNKLENGLQLVNETQLAVTNRQRANSALHFTC